MDKLFEVEDRVCLVTGGTSGIGRMAAKGLAERGAKVYVCGLASDGVASVVAELNKITRKHPVVGFECDLSSEQGVKNVVSEFRQHEDKLDLLVSNAGVRKDPSRSVDVLHCSLDELQESMLSSAYSDWELSLRVNTIAHYFLVTGLADLLAKSARQGDGRGSVVITSSCASMHNCTNVDLSSYATTKAATDHLVRILACKFNRWYIRINSINPGFIPSNMNKVSESGNIFANLFDKVPAKRAGNEDDVVGTIIFLASKAGDYVHGQNICMDGGRILVANGQE